ncbi:MAG TPA: MFS transporter [Gemmatimonadales bacterium]|nr:MFS transporter [Gemmatimonadales bacterium]
MSPTGERSLASRLGWIALIAFSSGFPFGFFNELIPVYLRTQGTSLEVIGLASWASLPWALKFLWAPLVDRIGRRRWWIVSCQAGLALVLAAFAGLPPSQTALFVLLFALVALSATQDIAVDAYTIEVTSRSELGPANGVRVTAYRLAMIVAGGAMVGLSGRFGWSTIFLAGAGLFVLLALLDTRLPRVERASAARQPLIEPVRELLAAPGIAAVLLFVLLFKLGDLALTPMVKPFWLDSGYSVEAIGWLQTTIGLGASIIGALLGGLLTQRMGTYRALWVLGGVQALSNLGYLAAASAGAPPALMYPAVVIEQFTAGLGTAAFLAFLMSLCSRVHAATQFALLSALYRVAGIAAASVSGFMTVRFGYSSYFLITFLLALPGFALLPWVRRALDTRISSET